MAIPCSLLVVCLAAIGLTRWARRHGGSPGRRLHTRLLSGLRNASHLPSSPGAATDIKLEMGPVASPRADGADAAAGSCATERLRPLLKDLEEAAAAAGAAPLLLHLYRMYHPTNPSLTTAGLQELAADGNAKAARWRKPLLLASRDFHPDRGKLQSAHALDTLSDGERQFLCEEICKYLSLKRLEIFPRDQTVEL